ncbi:acyltransferase [Desulfobacula sp.]|uniref:acyltransferase n=1 Tax=Desulfobacula sp. TaxID=2593537 RepID=UPI0025BC8119|nr:acyltransferase [Desulfobacula sp.]MBC2704227.1 acyltransferase [Desulfobacula sp.]
MYSLIYKTRSFWGYIKVKYFYKKHIVFKGKINISGIPSLIFKENGQLIIGSNVSLKSNKDSYHLHMYAPVKLMADRKDAVIEIGDNTRINGACIHAYKKISIGKNCLIAANCQIFDGNGHDISFPDVENRINTVGKARKILIEDNVWIGANSMVFPGVTIGYGSVIGAGSIVNRDIPRMCLAGGNPVQIIKQFEEKQQ